MDRNGKNMADNDAAKAPQKQEAPKPAPETTLKPDELQDLVDFLRTHGISIVVGLLVAVAVISAVSLNRTHKAKTLQEAGQTMFSAKSLKDLEFVIEKYPSTPYAPLAFMKLAKEQFNIGNYDLAMQKYAEFRTRFPKHELADAADLGKAFCLEARGQPQDALGAFKAFVDGHAGHYLAPQAILGQARCLEELGRDSEARTICEDFIANHKEGAWNDKAEEILAAISRRAEEGKREEGRGQRSEVRDRKTSLLDPSGAFQMPAFGEPAPAKPGATGRKTEDKSTGAGQGTGDKSGKTDAGDRKKTD